LNLEVASFLWQLQPVAHILRRHRLAMTKKADMLGRTAEKLLNFGP